MQLRLVLAVMLALLALMLPAQAQDVLSALRTNRWAEAQAAAAGYADPVAVKLVTYFRLLTPGAASAGEIADFIATSPDWPAQAVLAKRRDEALAAEPLDGVVRDLCGKVAVSLANALARCADAFANVGQSEQAADAARRAWFALGANPDVESRFMQRWAGVLTPQDQLRRFDELAWTDPAAASRQMLRLDQDDRVAAAARLALHRDDPTAAVLLGKVSTAARASPGLFLEQARWLRRAGRDDDALALWIAGGTEAEAACAPAHLAQFWTERNLLARRRLRMGDSRGAYALADGNRQRSPEQVIEAEFLAGFIALRWLGEPDTATQHFARMQSVATAAMSVAKVHYWLGRAAAQRQDQEGAVGEYQQAAAFGTTYYGQLAALALGKDPASLAADLAELRDPVWTDQQVVAFAGREMARAAELLVAWGDSSRVRSFLMRLEESSPDDTGRALPAHLATELGMPELAVAIARRAGRDGAMLPVSGWPMPIAIPPGPVPASLTLGIIRQESSFDTSETSPVGARGLMQLMPGTAREVGLKLGIATSVPALTTNPTLNVTLGTAYLRTLLARFGGSVPLAAAAYNAGPGRVVDWLAGNGDPRVGPVDMVDWIELIPIDETRNYVQRVVENTLLYAAKQGDQALVSLAGWRPSLGRP
jgi:soluble lytic murein transglycosylase